MNAPRLTLSEFVNRAVDVAVDEFVCFVPADVKTRLEADWWREFLAFVAMRQNFPGLQLREGNQDSA